MKRNALTCTLGGLLVLSLLSCGGSGAPTATFLPSNYNFTAIDPALAGFNSNRSGVVIQDTADHSNILFASSFSNYLAGQTTGVTLPASAATIRKVSINNAGVFVVNCDDAGQTTTFPAVYTSVDATPILPPLPNAVTRIAAKSINLSQQIVAIDDQFPNPNVYFYASPTATPVLIGPVDGSASGPRLSTSGAIMMVQPSGAQVVYPTPTSTPITFSPNLTDCDIVRFTVDNKLVGSYRSGSVMQAAYFSPINYSTPVFLPVPAGSTESYVLDITPQGVGVGFYADASNIFHGCIWPTLTSQPVDFTSAGSLTVDRLDYVMDDGSIIGYHYDNSVGTYFLLTPK